MEKENLIQGATFNLSTGGNPIQIIVGVSDLKSERTKSANMMPFQMLLTLQTVLELSKAGTQVLVSSLKSSFGPNCITKNIFGKLEELQSYVESFYTAELVEFREKAGSKIDCNLVFVKNTSDFVMHIINKRKLNPYKAFVNIAVGGGGGFLKVACNVFDPENLHSCSSKYQDSGVQRIQILAIVEDIPESNWNLGLILSKLKLEEVNYYIAFDLKCANAVLGLSTHSGKYACLYCTGLCSLISGDCRTFGSLDYWAQKYKDGCTHTKMSN